MSSGGTEVSARDFYQRQLDYLTSKDVEGLIEEQYAEDALLVSPDFQVRGHDALKEHFKGYLDMLGDLKVKSTDKFQAAADTIFFEATVESKLGEAQVYDAWVLRDGKIKYHFTGVK